MKWATAMMDMENKWKVNNINKMSIWEFSLKYPAQLTLVITFNKNK